ncbi:hypothetical protein K2173_017373 [Erythroxylum novogranatense]|uniref:Uncharacterized protein n=1 Tax=Erythroxylum novogranatense TaxID=1862640 RepID=A0AAV8TMK2_9ROSI|nr:hypothetical protein K2173_017373 [Erythroxylum novogranatense]
MVVLRSREPSTSPGKSSVLPEPDSPDTLLAINGLLMLAYGSVEAESVENFVEPDIGGKEEKGKKVEEVLTSQHSSEDQKWNSFEEGDVAFITREIPEVRTIPINIDNKWSGKHIDTDSWEYRYRRKQFRDLARPSADYTHQDPIKNNDGGTPHTEEEPKLEGRSDPFSAAIKFIRDRTKKGVPILWTPNNNRGSKSFKESIPSLVELCLGNLAKYADAITSLENIPDELRHQLCLLLCDSRRMDSRFLDLLIRGSPSEIRFADCSWLTEEKFTNCFLGCDTSNLMVLQLDLCASCLTDYTLRSTLVRSPFSFPLLSTLSLTGSRLSDAGFQSLISSAPALQSINLCGCFLLTSASVNTLANSLRSVLKELYLDDCPRIDAPTILPALKKLERLEVLSLARIGDVSDKFVRVLIAVRGHIMKELILTDCINLTDSSLKVISASCPGLRALDLVNLQNLTDSSLGYLANGCPQLQILKLYRNAFSDEAIAAYLETSGELLTELAFNKVVKVGNNTALSLASRARNLISLDLSWCRNLTDETLGLIVDNCLSLRVLKLFGCSQITGAFVDGHSNPRVKIIGLNLSPLLKHLRVPYFLRVSAAFKTASSCV